MGRYIIAAKTRNQEGVLNRMTSMFRRRQFNIASLIGTEAETPAYSRVTVLFDGEECTKDLLINQMYNLPDVLAVKELKAESTYSCELILMKVRKEHEQDHDKIMTICQSFGAVVVFENDVEMMLQFVGEADRLSDFIDKMRDFVIMEICRTGTVALERDEVLD